CGPGAAPATSASARGGATRPWRGGGAGAPSPTARLWGSGGGRAGACPFLPPASAPSRAPAIPPIFPVTHAELSPMKTQGANTDVMFLSGVRTGFGAFGSSLRDHSATDLGAVAARCALERSGVPATAVGHVVVGNALQTSADAIYCARHVGLKAGLPIEVPAVTVNRLCGSGFEAIT